MKKLGLIGKEISHSYSPSLFKKLLNNDQLQNELEYQLYPIKQISDLNILLENHPEIIGLNVTIPYKTEVIPYLSEIDPSAEKIGAVNTLVILDSNSKKIKGYNTDYYGFKNSLINFLAGYLPKQALIIGTGGASKTAAIVLNELKINYKFISTSKFSDQNIININDLSSNYLSETDLIINCSPIGMWPKTETSPLENFSDTFNKNQFVFDMIYNPEKSKLLIDAKLKGAQIKNGLEMLELQAQKSWEIWKNLFLNKNL